ncbi:DUF4139 domain-containing protein [Roseovarius salinarum]|uniref:DUF4139 domain-containing protein n=1 Tax=Roseovarius salinarum TaxID=1981892 RepID=UPI000C337B4A|nr:DUF4139 domain-containing protein [Roseovarius salinarum]
MRALSPVLAFVMLPAAVTAEDIPVRSDVADVTLYPRGATVERNARFEVPAGRHQLILTDLPKTTPLSGVRVNVEGATMGAVTTRRNYVPPRDPDTSEEIEAARAEVERLEDELREGEAAVEEIRLERDAARARVEFLRKLGDRDGLAEMDVATLRELTGMIGEETLAAMETAHDARQRAEAADRALEDTREALEEARAALDAMVPEDEARAMLAVAVEAEETTQGSVHVSYTTDRAGWQPVYDLRLARDSGRLEIEQAAFVSQSTGENWEDVGVTLTTVRPSEQTAPSEIHPRRRRIEDPEPEPKMRSDTVEGLSMSRAPAAEPAVVREEAAARFDGLSVTYDYPSPVDVASKADRLRLSLGTLEARAETVARAVPLRDDSAFLMARFENDTGTLVLPTREARFYLDGRFVGQRAMGMIPAGAEARLSFGPIHGLRLTRTVLGREEGDRGVITRSSELTEEVRIEVENLTGEAWPVRVLDRVPYSEQEDLEITWQAQPRPAETDVDGKRGILAWSFELPAGESRTIELDKRLEWPDGKVLR